MQGPVSTTLRGFHKVFSRSLEYFHARPQMSAKPQREHADTHKMWRGSRKRSTWAPHDNESNPTRAQWQEGYTSDIKMKTAPQWELSSTNKVTRGLRERYQDEYRATTRLKKLMPGATLDITVPIRLVRHLLQVSWPSKNEAQASEVFSPSERIGAKKHHPSSPHCACQAKKTGSLQGLSFWPTLASILATCMKYCACHADEKVSEVLCLPHKTKFWPSKSAESLTPAAKNVHSSKNGGGTQVWTGHVFVRGWSPSKNEDRWTFVP